MIAHTAGSFPRLPVLLCLSHLRWNFVYQRPQHLMARLAKRYRVWFVEEPLAAEDGVSRLEALEAGPGVRVLVPRFRPEDLSDRHRSVALQRRLLDDELASEPVGDRVVWFYTPMALPFTEHLPGLVVYDCMDELSAFAGAPPEMGACETRLLSHADIVLTGGRSLFAHKRDRHRNVHCLPSSVDVRHFAQARMPLAEPADQVSIPRPRIGFAGVIDERMDLDLVAGVARARPDWHLVMLGPVAKIDPAALPSLPNIHFLGMKSYQQLPNYLAGWDAAIMPFAHNSATRFISPTKTPEYLAAGRPVVSTSISDVVTTYGTRGLAAIADSVPAFVAALAAALVIDKTDLHRRADRFLQRTSWDDTVRKIEALIADQRETLPAGKTQRAASGA